jgi:hypothetical protein
MATYQELADAAELAILDILQNGQSITFQGQTYNKANLQDLFSVAKSYRTMAASNPQSSNILQRATFGVPGRWQNGA